MVRVAWRSHGSVDPGGRCSFHKRVYVSLRVRPQLLQGWPEPVRPRRPHRLEMARRGRYPRRAKIAPSRAVVDRVPRSGARSADRQRLLAEPVAARGRFPRARSAGPTGDQPRATSSRNRRRRSAGTSAGPPARWPTLRRASAASSSTSGASASISPGNSISGAASAAPSRRPKTPCRPPAPTTTTCWSRCWATWPRITCRSAPLQQRIELRAANVELQTEDLERRRSGG